MDYQFKRKWPEDTDISWWKTSRVLLNKIIELYNDWQTEGFNENEAKLILAKIRSGKETLGALDGGSGYCQDLDEMETFVLSIYPEYENEHEDLTYTLEDIIDAVQYGFEYREESQNDGDKVPTGNILQWLMGKKNLTRVPDEFKNL